MRKPFYKASHGAWYVTVNGKQVRLGTDQAEAEKEYHRLLAADAPVTTRTTVAQLIDKFLGWAEANKAPRTFEWYCGHCRSFVKSIGYKMLIDKVTPNDVDRWLTRSYKNSGDSHKAGACRAVSRAFNWAKKQRLITASPIAGMERPTATSRECYLTPDQWQELVDHLDADDSFTDIVWFLHETGARPQEARIVAAKMFDRDKRRFELKLKDSKGKKYKRVIRLNDKAFAICQRLAVKYPDGPLFRNKAGTPWKADILNKRFARLRGKLKKEKVKAGTWERDKEWVGYLFPYALRHTFVTDALKRGVDPLTVSHLAGHRDATMVMRVYSHLSQDDEFLADKLKQATTALDIPQRA
jgi:integrase